MGRKGVLAHVVEEGKKRVGRPVGAKNVITTALVEEQLSWIALFDPLALYKEVDGAKGIVTMRLRTLREMPRHIRSCIASIKIRTENLTSGDGVQEQVVEVKFWDKLKALELCAKHLGYVSGKAPSVTVESLRALLEEGRMRNAQRLSALPAAEIVGPAVESPERPDAAPAVDPAPAEDAPVDAIEEEASDAEL